MNERGEIVLSTCLINFVLLSIFLLCTYELKQSFSLLEKRTQLFLCTKEAKGELSNYLKTMGRSNWAIKNINKAKLVMLFIPGLQGIAMNTEKAKKYLQHYQNISTVSYLKNLSLLSQKSCLLDPRMFITPFKFGQALLERNSEGAAILREEKWIYLYSSKPYLLTVEINAAKVEAIKPQLNFITQEKWGKLPYPLSFP